MDAVCAEPHIQPTEPTPKDRAIAALEQAQSIALHYGTLDIWFRFHRLSELGSTACGNVPTAQAEITSLPL